MKKYYKTLNEFNKKFLIRKIIIDQEKIKNKN